MRRSALVVAIALLAATGLQAVAAETRTAARVAMHEAEEFLNAWDLEAAKEALAEVERVAPSGSSPIAYLRGRIAYEEGRYADAVSAFEAAGPGGESEDWLRFARATAGVLKGFAQAESEHFTVLYAPGADAVLVPWTLEALEAQRAALATDLGYAPPGKVRIEFVSSTADLSTLSTLGADAIRTTGTVAICKFSKLIVTSPRALLTGYDWLDTVAHEYTHLVISRKSRNRVPIWMHEGLAKYLESRWRGPAGGAMTPASLALLGTRVRSGRLIPFEKMHPSMALLPTAEDAAVAFSEVFFAVKLIHRVGGADALARLLDAMRGGGDDKLAVQSVTHQPWPQFERAWMASLKNLEFPKELVPRGSNEKREFTDDGKARGEQRRGRDKKSHDSDVSYGDFAEVAEPQIRRDAHLGELLRERKRMGAAAEVYETAWKKAGNRYESISNKYALTLLELKRYDEAERVLAGSLTMHPGSASTNVHLGRLRIRSRSWAAAKRAYLDALGVNPFDPEVHLGLMVAAAQLHDESLLLRARSAAMTLLNADERSVQEAAQRFAGLDDLSRADEVVREAQAPEKADAGATGGGGARLLKDAGR